MLVPLAAAAILELTAMRQVRAESRAAVSVLTPSVDLGTLAPDSSAVDTTVQLVVSSDQPWQLFVKLDALPASALAYRAIPADTLQIRASSSDWVSVTSGLSTLIIEGAPTRAEGQAVPVQIRARVSWQAAPARYRSVLRWSVANGAAAPIDVTYEIPVAVRVVAEGTAFESPKVNPAKADLYPYTPRMYTVRSNVPWQMEAAMTTPLYMQSGAEWRSNPLHVLGIDGAWHPIAARTPVVVAAGSPTGFAQIPVKVAARVTGGEVGGVYTTQIEVTAHAQDR